MPINLGRDIDGCFARWGSKGAKYHYECGNETQRTEAKVKALKQASAMGYFYEWRKNKNLTGDRIGFDFDGTLTTEKYRNKAIDYIQRGFDVYIITRRNKMFSKQVYDLADELGIKRENIYFTNGELKVETIKKLNIDLFYDNNKNEIDKINELMLSKWVK